MSADGGSNPRIFPAGGTRNAEDGQNDPVQTEGVGIFLIRMYRQKSVNGGGD